MHVWKLCFNELIGEKRVNHKCKWCKIRQNIESPCTGNLNFAFESSCDHFSYTGSSLPIVITLFDTYFVHCFSGSVDPFSATEQRNPIWPTCVLYSRRHASEIFRTFRFLSTLTYLYDWPERAAYMCVENLFMHTIRVQYLHVAAFTVQTARFTIGNLRPWKPRSVSRFIARDKKQLFLNLVKTVVRSRCESTVLCASIGRFECEFGTRALDTRLAGLAQFKENLIGTYSGGCDSISKSGSSFKRSTVYRELFRCIMLLRVKYPGFESMYNIRNLYDRCDITSHGRI